MARAHPVHALLDWLGDNAASRGRNPDMVNRWSSNDMPAVSSLGLDGLWPELCGDAKRFGAAAALTAVVDYLNEHFPKPPFAEEGIRMIHERDELRTRVNALECDRDRWRRAHEIVEGERDLARDRCQELERERDEARSKWAGQESDL